MNPRETSLGGVDRAEGGEVLLRPADPIRAEHEQRDGVEPVAIDEHGGPSIQEVADRPALEFELGISLEGHDRSEVQAALEPGFDLVDAAALDLERLLAREDAQVIVDRLRDQRGAGVERRDQGAVERQYC